MVLNLAHSAHTKKIKVLRRLQSKAKVGKMKLNKSINCAMKYVVLQA